MSVEEQGGAVDELHGSAVDGFKVQLVVADIAV